MFIVIIVFSVFAIETKKEKNLFAHWCPFLKFFLFLIVIFAYGFISLSSVQNAIIHMRMVGANSA